MIRTALLTLLLIAVGVGLALPSTGPWLGDVDTYLKVVLWGIPASALILSLLLKPRLPRPGPEDQPPGPLPRRLVLIAVAALAFAADQSFLGVSDWTGWATFTSSSQDQSLAKIGLTAAWALPLCLILSIWGWERALRGALYTGWRRFFPRPAAIAVSALVGLVLSLPPVIPGEVRSFAFVGAALVTILCREISLALLFSRGGGLLVAGLYRGALFFVEAFLVHDWYSLYFPAYSYVTSGTPFYVVRAASAVLSLVVVAALARPPRPSQNLDSGPPA